MQIYHISICMCLVSCYGNSTTFALNMVRALLMSPMKEEMTKFTWMKLHSLPRDKGMWTRPANVK